MKKLTKIWGIGLVVVLVASLLISAAPVSAGQLSFGSATIPSATNLVIAAGSDVTDMAVGSDGTTIWIADGAAPALYKSTDGGQTFSSKTRPTGLTTPALIAIAPDDSDIVVVGGDTTEAYVTTDGGANWATLGAIIETGQTTLATMLDIAISPDDSGKHYIAVAGTDAGGANVWYFDLGDATPLWTETQTLAGVANDFGNGTVPDSAFAVAFSPNFASDKVMTVLTEEDTGDDVELEIFSFSTKEWNDAAGFTSYPVEIVSPAGLISAVGDIALAPDYLGSDDAMRIAFVGIDVTATANDDDGIYRLKDTSVKDVSSPKDVGSIAYDGTNLVAGQSAGGNAVYRSADPLASSPTVSTTSSLKRPGGDTNVVVAWAGADVFAGTRGASSSFNISRDNGKSFNGLSLVDEATVLLNDVTLSADGGVTYLSADDGADLSIWREAGSWERVLAVDGVFDAIVRIAPEDPNIVYVADVGAQTMYYSSEGGDTKWFVRSSRYSVTDFAVESADVVYVANAATVSKSTNAGFTWGTAKGTGLTGGTVHMIKSLSEDNLIVGSTTGYVAWSSDGNSNWSKSTKQVNDSGNPIQVMASGLADGDFIYAGTEAVTLDIDRWEIGESTSWSDIISGLITAGESVRGIALDSNGAIYAVADDGTDSTVYRALSPSTASSTTTWSTMSSAGETFAAAPTALRLTEADGATKLWFINTAANTLFSYTDDMVSAGPTLSGPADGSVIQVNPVSGGTFTVPLSWERASKATSYDVQVAVDSAFAEKILTPTVASTSGTVSSVQSGTTLMPDTTYYWRVRADATGPIYSPWSEVRSFTIGSLPEAAAPVIIQQPPAPVIEVPPAPEIVLQPPDIILPAPTPAPEIVIPAAPAPAPAVPSWAIYAIIIIGAVLVIALIVLIMRTRRPV